MAKVVLSGPMPQAVPVLEYPVGDDEFNIREEERHWG